MSSIVRHVSTIFRCPSLVPNSLSCELQQWRGIRVKVFNGNLESALVVMQRKMQSSGIERLIKREQTHHIKNSEKRVLARKNLERRIRSQDWPASSRPFSSRKSGHSLESGVGDLPLKEKLLKKQVIQGKCGEVGGWSSFKVKGLWV
ncbi:hypothetical protein CK203_106320 [Vitis vinifera]|uniref:Uncharacterized protein n=1 Tax=Vitis vinifera TaxID=29760 RepID=A0A438CDU0_VITVI|nr:hypothetical protein CK203_106320 [Vitis vinifera]